LTIPNWASGPQNQPKANVADCRFSGTARSTGGTVIVDVSAIDFIGGFLEVLRSEMPDGLIDDVDSSWSLTINH
jgi:hypothetical protein